MKLISWNVNGIRAAARKGFGKWLAATDADIVGLQETRSLPEQMPKDLRAPADWHVNLFAAERKGYSGVAIYSRQAPDRVITQMGVEAFDAEGRTQIAEFGELVVANVYFPNGSGKNRDNSRIPFKLDFYKKLYDMLQEYAEAGRPVVCMGDFNTAHEDIDLARPTQNRKTSGFRPEEREELDRWIQSGWTDSYRHLHPDTEGAYTWWSNRRGVREKNIGWRIDYALLSPAAKDRLVSASIHANVLGSDHCPIEVELALP